MILERNEVSRVIYFDIFRKRRKKKKKKIHERKIQLYRRIANLHILIDLFNK